VSSLRVACGDGGYEAEKAERFVFDSGAEVERKSRYETFVSSAFHLNELFLYFNFWLPAHPQVVESRCAYCAGLGCGACGSSGTSLRWLPATPELLEQVRTELLCMLHTLTYTTGG